MTKTKKRLLIIIPIIAVSIAAVFCLWWFVLRDDGSSSPVSVEKVSVIAGMSGGLQNRFPGLVEPQATLDVELDTSRTLDETFVEVGDEVAEGDELFSYNTEEIQLQIEQMQLDIDRVKSTISSLESQISTLKKQRDKVTSDSLKLEYTQQIQSYEAQVKQEEYNLKSKQLELEKLEDKSTNFIVYAEMDGIIKSISDTSNQGNNYYDTGSTSNAYITILALGDFRIKGQINEQNIWDLELGAEVLIRSRLDSEVTWLGYVDYVDMENPVANDNSMYYGSSSDTMTSTTKYPFYISLEETEGLMLGQHVYIEPSVITEDTGLWLMEYYIMTDDDGTAWVWAVNQDKDRIEKRVVTLGGYDVDTSRFEIISGLTPEDEIAWPSDDIRAGMAVTREGFVDYGYGDQETEQDPGGPVIDEPIDIIDDPLEDPFEEEDIPEETDPPADGEITPEAPVITSDFNEDDLIMPLPSLTPQISGSDVPRATAPASASSVG